MEKQLTVRLPAGLARKLERLARQSRRRRSELVRLALEQFLESPGKTAVVRPIDLVRDLIGIADLGIPDLGERHRDYLISRLRHGRSTDS